MQQCDVGQREYNIYKGRNILGQVVILVLEKDKVREIN
jgi:hypothetical protein